MTNHQQILIFVALTSILFHTNFGFLMPKDVAKLLIKTFEEHQYNNRSVVQFGEVDRRPSAPFITGDGFRDYCPHRCEPANATTRECHMKPEAVKDGDCVFVKTDSFDYFVKEVMNRILSKFVLVSHNGDMSAPDGQDDAPKTGLPSYVTSDLLRKAYDNGKLISHHGQNLWWKNNSLGVERPAFSHCLPIGFENRQYPIGKNIQNYIPALVNNVIKRPLLSLKQQSALPLLLVAFYPNSRAPDRQKVLQAIGARGQKKLNNPMSHHEWLNAIGQHRFILAPFGHGLDTHRVSEIMLMGGIPVMRRSTISSCYDDTDNTLSSSSSSLSISTSSSRGSLPIVLLDSWQELNKARLELEWERIAHTPASQWDWSRLFLDHWLQRINVNTNKTFVHNSPTTIAKISL